MTGNHALAATPTGRKAIFLDRDGVINDDTGYLHRIEDCTFAPDVFSSCRQLRALNFELLIITNQSGIARGIFDVPTFWKLTDWMLGQFRDRGVEFLAVYFCPHHPGHGELPYRCRCRCRKPAPGLIFDAIAEHGIDPSQSWMVGDSPSDIAAGKAAGIGYTALICNGSHHQRNVADFHFSSLKGLAEMLAEDAQERSGGLVAQKGQSAHR